MWDIQKNVGVELGPVLLVFVVNSLMNQPDLVYIKALERLLLLSSRVLNGWLFRIMKFNWGTFLFSRL